MDVLTGFLGFLATVGSLTAVLLSWWVWHSDNQAKRRAQAETITGWAVSEDSGANIADAGALVPGGGIVLVNSGAAAVSEVDFKTTGTTAALINYPGRRLSTLPPGSYYFRQMIGDTKQPWTGPFPIHVDSGRFEVSVPSDDAAVEGSVRVTLVPITAIPEQRKLVWLGFTDAAGVPWARVAIATSAGQEPDRAPTVQPPVDGPSSAFSFVSRLWEVRTGSRRFRADLLDREAVVPAAWTAMFEASASTDMTRGSGRRPDATTESIADFMRQHLVIPLTGADLSPADRSRREIPVPADSDLAGVVTEIVTAGGTGMGLTFRTAATDATGGSDVFYLAGSRNGTLPAEFWFGHLDRTKGPRTQLRAELLASTHGRGKKRVEDWAVSPDSLRQAVVEVMRTHAARM